MYSTILGLQQPASGNTEQALIFAILKVGSALQSQPADLSPSNPYQAVVNDLATRLGADNLAVQRVKAFFAPQIERYASGAQRF
ncbi:hypothetical protein [Lacipirellula sp.]|uniref:hypothetical protein n=1 Tax=Lacipirellula sp. TaxID=2691419 RepID=UPI003D0C318F